MSRTFTPRGWGVIALAMTLCAVVLAASIAQAADVTLAWNASTSAGVTGYRIHQGIASGEYLLVKDAGRVTTTVVTGLTAGETYYFAATAYDAEGNSSLFSNEVTYLAPLPPVANFTATPVTGPAPLAVAFTNTTTGTATEWLWTFGDGSAASALQHPSHTYTTAGIYTVTLTATGPGGTHIATQTNSIRVTVLPPVAPTNLRITLVP